MDPAFAGMTSEALGSHFRGNDEAQKRNGHPKVPAALPITCASAQNRHCPEIASRLPELSKWPTSVENVGLT